MEISFRNRIWEDEANMIADYMSSGTFLPSSLSKESIWYYRSSVCCLNSLSPRTTSSSVRSPSGGGPGGAWERGYNYFIFSCLSYFRSFRLGKYERGKQIKYKAEQSSLSQIKIWTHQVKPRDTAFWEKANKRTPLCRKKGQTSCHSWVVELLSVTRGHCEGKQGRTRVQRYRTKRNDIWGGKNADLIISVSNRHAVPQCRYNC